MKRRRNAFNFMPLSHNGVVWIKKRASYQREYAFLVLVSQVGRC